MLFSALALRGQKSRSLSAKIYLFLVMVLLLAGPLCAQEPCAPLAVPSSFDFESTTATSWNVRGELPECWNFVFMGNDSTYVPHISADSAINGNSILMAAGIEPALGKVNCVVLPAINASYSDISIAFQTKMSRNAGTLSLGYWHTDGVASYFVNLIPISTSTSTVSHFYSLRDLVIPEGDHLAFSWSVNDSCALCVLDSIAFDSLELCLAPTISSIQAVSESQIRLDWAAGWTEQNWIVEYGPAGFILGNGIQQFVDTPLFVSTTLNPSTSYDFYVKSVCSDELTSIWTPVVTCSTPCSAVQVPYVENMESYTGTAVGEAGVIPECWSYLSDASPARAPHISTYNAVSGVNGLVLTAKNASGFSADNYVALPWFSSNLNGLKISFMSRMDNAAQGALTLGYFTNVSDASSFVVLESVPSTTAAGAHEYSLYGRNIPDGARLAFRWYSASPAWDWRCVIDDVSVDFLPCPPVSNVQVSDIMMTTARISWNKADVEDTWRVEYGPAGYNHDSTATAIVLNDTTLLLTDLQGNQPLDVYVQSLCDPNNPSPYSEVLNFTPYCSSVGDTTVVVACDSFVWHDVTYVTTGVYVDTLAHAAAYSCDSITVLDLTINNSVEQFDTLTICQNELPYTWRDTVLEVGTDNSDLVFHRSTLNGCDSIVNLNVTVFPAFYQNEEVVICQQELPYTWRDTTFAEGTESGEFVFNRNTIYGCDSVVTLQLTINESYDQTEYARICQQELPYTWRDTTFAEGTNSGIFTFHRASVNGCDSVVTFVLVVDPSYNEEVSLTLCRSELPYEWRGQQIAGDAVSEVLYFNGQTVNGCDSSVTLNLVINETATSEETVEICAGELPYVWRDQVFREGTETGNYVYHRTSAAGCDSTATLHLIVYPTYSQDLYATICENELPYTFGDTLFAEGSQTQNVTRHLQSQYGCDSIVNLHLTVNQTVSRYETLDICRSELPYSYYDTVFHVGTPSDVYTIHRQTVNGCDSVIYLTLNIRQSFGASERIEVCEDELPIVWHNEIIARGTPTGTYTFSRQTQYGCDSIMVLNLVVNPLYRQNEEITICENDLPYTWRDTTFEVGTVGGTFLFEKAAQTGCDSVVILKLTVHPAFEASETITLCDSELPYSFLDTTFAQGTQSGDYQFVRATQFGCDSIVNLHLIIYPTAETDDYITLCQNELPISYMGTTFPIGTQSQDRDFHFRTVNGCDSLVHLHLTVNPIHSDEDFVTVCASELPYYYAPADTTFEVGTGLHSTFTFHFATANSCDSTLTLHLTVNPAYSENNSIIICQNELPYTWRDTTFQIGTQSGVYQFERTSMSGCDSVVTLALIVRPSYDQFESVDVCANGFPFVWRDTTFQTGTTAGEYVFHRNTIFGCDSIVTLQLNINPIYNQNEALAICESELPYTWRDITYPTGTISGIYTYERQTVNGCDSVVTLVLTVRPTFSQTFNVQVCENNLPYYYAQTDTTFGEGTTSGTYRFEYANTYGCDSIVIVNLVVHPYYEGEESLTICSNELPYYYERENRTFQIGTTTGDYQFNHSTSYGCDSTWTLHLTVNPSYHQTEMVQICENELPFQWRDTTFEVGTMSGSFTFNRTTQFGCDSVVNLTLFVYPVPVATISGATEIDLGESVTLIAHASGCTFEWSIGAQDAAITVTPDTAGTYIYTVTATHPTTHCSSSASHTVIVADTLADTTAIHSFVLSYNIDVFPNPATDIVTVRTDNEPMAQVEIYNMMGALVRRTIVGDVTTQLDLSAVAPGTYVLQIKLQNGDVARKKLIIR